MADSPVVGSASFELRATKQKLGEDIKSAERDLKVFSDNAEKNASAGARGIGASIGRMAAGAMVAVTGLVTVIGLAAAGALNLGLQGMRMADDLANSARRIGIGTDALQEWRHVAQKTGGDARDADKALDSFATKLAQATSGTSKSAVKAFEFLGFGPEELRKIKSTEEGVDKVTDAIKSLKTETDRIGAAEAVGLGGMSNALRDGAVDVAALRDEARQLGIVMDQELIKRASEAQGELDTLSQVIDVQLKSAFVDLAPAIIAVMELARDVANEIGRIVDNFRQLPNRTTITLRAERENIMRDQSALYLKYGSVEAMDRRSVDRPTVVGSSGGAAGPGGALMAQSTGPSARDTWNSNAERMAAIDKILAERAAIATPARTDRSGGGTLDLPEPRAPKGPVDRSAEREARRAELDLQNALDLARASGDEAAIRAAEEKLDIARLTAAFERAGYDDAAFRATTQVAAMNELLIKAEQMTKLEESSVEFMKEAAKAHERNLELLDMQLSDQIEIARLSGDEGLLKSLLREEEIRRRIADLRRLTPGMSEEAARKTATATTDDRDSADRIGNMREEFRNAFTGGVQAAMEGDLGGFFDSLADRFTSRMLDNLADDLFDLLDSAMSGTKGDKGGWLSTAATAIGGFFGGGRAFGGPVQGGMAYRVGEHGPETLMMPGNGFVVPDGAFSAGNTTDGPRSGGGGNSYTFSGNMMTSEFWQQIQGEMAQTEARAYGRAMNDAPKLTMAQTAKQQSNAVGRRRR